MQGCSRDEQHNNWRCGPGSRVRVGQGPEVGWAGVPSAGGPGSRVRVGRGPKGVPALCENAPGDCLRYSVVPKRQ